MSVGQQLIYREAAKRVGRTPRAIRYWRQDGMPVGWDIRNGQRVRVVDEKVLLATHRQRASSRARTPDADRQAGEGWTLIVRPFSLRRR